MTREEAVEVLKERYLTCVGIGLDNHANRVNEAIDTAIEALWNEPTPCEKCIHVKSCRKVIILKNRTYKLVKYCSQGVERKKP